MFTTSSMILLIHCIRFANAIPLGEGGEKRIYARRTHPATHTSLVEGDFGDSPSVVGGLQEVGAGLKQHANEFATELGEKISSPMNDIENIEKDAENALDMFKDSVPPQLGPAGDVAKEVIGDIKTVEHQVLAEGPVHEVREIIKADIQDPQPCESIASCLHVMTMSVIFFCVAILVYSNACFEKSLVGKFDEGTKGDFQGDMTPIELSACPGGMGSFLCIVSYFCFCCLRMETFGTLEKWSSADKMKRIVLFSAVMLLGHVAAVMVAILFGLSKDKVHLVGVTSSLIFPLGMAALGIKMATWRMKLMTLKKTNEMPVSFPKQLAISACCVPCAAGQEAEFMETYIAAHGTEGIASW